MFSFDIAEVVYVIEHTISQQFVEIGFLDTLIVPHHQGITYLAGLSMILLGAVCPPHFTGNRTRFGLCWLLAHRTQVCYTARIQLIGSL